MPNLARDKDNSLHLVYGSGDSILYETLQAGGKSFSAPSLVAVLPGLFDMAMRGPQIACTDNGITVTASTRAGDIYSYLKDASGNWKKAARVNDIDTIAKEGLMALAGEGNTLFTVWLDLRGNKRNKIVVAKSDDGGKTWSKNRLISDSIVCDCCKPSVVMKGQNVFVMFRNSLKGSRDLYVIKSSDGGNSFSVAEKMGNGTWVLDGCPMDGGGIAVNEDNNPQTVWRRRDTIFACQPGNAEIEIGKGRGCVIESVNDKNVYAWAENGEIVCLLAKDKKQDLGKGTLPILKAINSSQVICIWQNDTQIHAAVLDL